CACTVFFFQAEDGIRDFTVTGVQTCALPIYRLHPQRRAARLRPPRGGDRQRLRVAALHDEGGAERLAVAGVGGDAEGIRQREEGSVVGGDVDGAADVDPAAVFERRGKDVGVAAVEQQ